MVRDWSECQSSNIWGDSNESGTDDAECCRKVASGKKVAGAIRSLINTSGLQLEFVRVLNEGLL